MTSWYDPTIVVGIVQGFFLVSAGAVAAAFAIWRYRIADKNLRHEQFQAAASKLEEERSGEIEPLTELRVRCIVMLGNVARKDPRGYHIMVMRVFENLLTRTTVYRGDKPLVSPDSNDMIETINFVETRSKKQMAVEQKEGYTFCLQDGSPFYISKDGKLYLKDDVLHEFTLAMKKRRIDSQFLKKRHPKAYDESRSIH